MLTAVGQTAVFSEKSVQGRAPESTSVSMRAEEELVEEPENELPESYEETRAVTAPSAAERGGWRRVCWACEPGVLDAPRTVGAVTDADPSGESDEG